jgi:hypothetical protein
MGHKTAGYIRIEVRWKHWPCLFPQHGVGRKQLRKIELADWQREIVAKCPEQLLRGLFHSDGCRFVNWATKVTEHIDGCLGPAGYSVAEAADQRGRGQPETRRGGVGSVRRGQELSGDR